MLHHVARGLGALFGGLALARGARPTHRFGVGAAGKLTVVESPAFPEHAFFAAGRVFPLRMRHATLEIADDAGLDIRSAALKLADDDFDSPLDIVMNTAEASLFRDTYLFLAFVRANARGVAGLAELAKKYPREMDVTVRGFRRAPSSFTQLRYHSQIIFRFRARDGLPRLVRYRLIPGDRGPEAFLPAPRDLEHPIRRERLADETRPVDYLRRELKERLAVGPARYWLQLQLHEEKPGDPPSVFDTSLAWDEQTHPWLDLAEVAIDRALSDEATERLRFNIGHQPPSLGVLPATSLRDFNSIGYLRTQVYPVSQKARRAQRKVSVETASSDETPTRSPSATRRVAVGRLVFHDADAHGDDVPLANVDVELWDRDFGKPDDFLGRAATDDEGRFEIAYDPADAGPHDLPDLDLRIVEITPAHDVGDGRGSRRRVIHTVRGDDDVTVARYDFGTVRVPCWDYHPGALPRVFVPPGGDLPQPFAEGRRASLLASLRTCADVRARHQLAHTRGVAPSLAAIQAAYPDNLTRRLERERPGHTRSDAYFGERLANGFYPAPLRRDDARDDVYRLRYRWDDLDFHPPYELANVDAELTLVDGALLPTRLVIQTRLPGAFAAGSPLAEPIDLTPRDGARWEQAKRIARVAHFVAGEIDGHLSRAHLDVEQYAVAAFRNLRRSPLRRLLFPHLKEVASINAQGAWLVFGDTGFVPRASALTSDAVEQRFAQQLATLDWSSFRPRTPLSTRPGFAHVATLYWDVLGTAIEAFFSRFSDDIARHWTEARAFSRDLVAHSVPHAPASLISRIDDPFAGERDDVSLPRTEHHGILRAVRPPVTEAHPNEADLARLRQLCRYVVYHATLWHSWVNDLQLEDGGDVTYGSLGLRGGSWGDEANDAIGPAPLEATDQLYLTRLLTGVSYGYILKNEDGDVARELLDALTAKRDAFRAVGFDAGRIRSRINI